MPERKLTPRQARFVDEYLIDLNATQAAIRAGYAERSARWQGQRLLRQSGIKSRLNAYYARIAKHAILCRTRAEAAYA